jgi:hypothetical protein
MKSNFAQVLSELDNSFYPLRFMASDFFTTYWVKFADPVPSPFVEIIQNAARKSVDYFMNGEEIYWNINFEEVAALKAWELFVKQTDQVPDEVMRSVHSLALQLAGSPSDSDNSDYFINLVTRLSHDTDFSEFYKYPAYDIEVLSAVMESSSEDLLDLFQVKTGWLASNTAWDKKLRSQTPDLLESVYIIFFSAYNSRSTVPLIQRNLISLMGNSQDYRDFIHRLNSVFENSLKDLNPRIKFPKIFLL